MNAEKLWERYKRHFCNVPQIGLSVDISRMNFADDFFERMSQPMRKAFDEMAELESGAVANADESRMVGHYWLRSPKLAPDNAIRKAIEGTVADIKSFAASVHGGKTKAANGRNFTDLLLVGIGGSALGPQFVTDALGGPGDRLRIHFFDNTDPDGMDRVLACLGDALATTLVLVVSKSGGTAETRNGMLEAKHRFESAGLKFEPHAVAITSEGSKLDQIAERNGWLKRFPMWDWVGGRTSELSAVGLVPAALQGFDIDGMLAGAAACDEFTRVPETPRNPAALMALMWYHAGQGRGAKDMVILPYKDRLALLSRYLQQLVMESLGKRLDRDGKQVHQGLAVYGNKGSTDQHAYVQQLRDGLNNFFATFVEVLRDRAGQSISVEEQVTSGDFLHGFFMGTRRALWEADRESMTITVEEVSARTVGALIALFERAVGFYASLININAYHQPGVEAGKKAASDVIDLQRKLLAAMRADSKTSRTAEEWAKIVGDSDQAEGVMCLLRHLSANGVCAVHSSERGPVEAKYQLSM